MLGRISRLPVLRAGQTLLYELVFEGLWSTNIQLYVGLRYCAYSEVGELGAVSLLFFQHLRCFDSFIVVCCSVRIV
jgi:hypothetical protein